MLRTQSHLYYGNVPGRVGDVISHLRKRLPGSWWAAVRSLDSGIAPSHIRDVLSRYGIDVGVESTGVFLSAEQVCHAAKEGVFVGFDELWIWREAPGDRQFPSDVALTSDAVNVKERLPDVLEATMLQMGCLLALGDGCGLNYVTTDPELAMYIEKDLTDSQ